MASTVERTAIASFNLDGKPIRAGQIVTVDALQLARLVKAGCVAESDEENAAVPKADLPATQRGEIDYRQEVEEAAAQAATQIAAIRKTVDDARSQGDADLETLRKRLEDAHNASDKAVGEHRERAEKASKEADADVKAHLKRVEKAGKDADAEIKAHQDRVATAKAGENGGGE